MFDGSHAETGPGAREAWQAWQATSAMHATNATSPRFTLYGLADRGLASGSASVAILGFTSSKKA